MAEIANFSILSNIDLSRQGHRHRRPVLGFPHSKLHGQGIRPSLRVLSVWVSGSKMRLIGEAGDWMAINCSRQEAISGCWVVIQTYVSLERQSFEY